MRVGLSRRAAGLAGGLLALLCAAARAEPPLPRFDGATHLGVGTCAGPCHGRQAALGIAEGAAMRGSEIVVWQDPNTSRGRHAQAFKSLATERAQAIGRKLGLAAVDAAPECLSCHGDAVSGARRGPRLLLSDGVSCEACHGGSSRWLAAHYAPNATHAQNLANGLYPTEDPAQRARLCASCHLGASAADQYVTHRLMAAGHPRLSYEAELFYSLQAHHFEDTDYARRKPLHPRAQAWAIGQAEALRAQLRLFLDSPHRGSGAFPELTFFDCHACHRTIFDADTYRPRVRPNPGRPLGPGVPFFNDANLIVLDAAARVVAPALAGELDARGRAFHAALAGDAGQVKATGEALAESCARLETAFASAAFDKTQVRAILRGVVSASLSERYTAYASAEQAIMAVDSLTRALNDAGPVPTRAPVTDLTKAAATSAPPPAAKTYQAPGMEAAYKTVGDPNAYDQDAFRKAIAEVANSLGVK